MNEQTVNIIINFLRQLGVEVTGKVEQLVEMSYPVVIKQVYVQKFEYFFWALVGVILIPLTYKWIKFVNKQIEEQRSWGNWEMGHMLSGLVGFCSFFMITFGIIGFVQRLINPQWYAAKLIFDLIKNGGM